MAKKAAQATKKSARKKTAAKKGAGRKRAPRPLLSADALPANSQAALYDAIERLLASRGVKGHLTSIHLTTDIQPLLCQPPKVRRMVCRKINGIVRCAPECVDP